MALRLAAALENLRREPVRPRHQHRVANRQSLQDSEHVGALPPFVLPRIFFVLRALERREPRRAFLPRAFRLTGLFR